MSKELSPSLRGFALQIALQLPDDQRQAISACDTPARSLSAVLKNSATQFVHPT